jgi:hypothetical protein
VIPPPAQVVGGQRQPRTRKGLLKRRIGFAKSFLSALMVEHVVSSACIEMSMVAPTTHCDVMYADLSEAFAGAGHPTRLAPSVGLTATPPAEIDSGWDLSNAAGQARWRHQIETEKPWLVIIGFPCTLWNKFSVNMNFSTPERRAILESRREYQTSMK